MLTADIRFTARDYRELPEDAPRVELLDGVFVMTPSPSERYQGAAGNLYFLLRQYLVDPTVGRAYIAPFDVYLSEHSVAQPDVFVVLSTHLDRVHDDGVHGPPDLVIEIASPSSAVQDLTLKRELYRRAGVPEYWIVDPKALTVAVYQLQESGHRAEYRSSARVVSRVLPDLALEVDAVFSR